MICLKYKFLLLFVLFIFPIIVRADYVSLSCNSDVVKRDNLSCVLKGNSEKLVIAVSAKIKVGNNILFSSFDSSSLWRGDGDEGNIDLYTSNDISGNFDIGTINFDVNKVDEGFNSSITIDSIFFYDEDGNEITINPITKDIRIASDINDLSSLSLSTGGLNPNFNSSVTTYSTVIDANSINISAKALSNYATLSGDIGTKKLDYGNNIFKVNVTSERGNVKTYTINVARLDNREPSNNSNNQDNNQSISKSSNTYLKEIELSSGSISFDKEKTVYDINVSYDTTDIEVIATSEDSKSKVEIAGNDNLVVGNNEIKILVTAEDSSTRLYTINVNRKEEEYTLSSNNNISNIIIDGYELYFNNNKYEYDLRIKDEKQLDIKVVLEDSKASYNIEGNKELKNNSVITITSKAEDNTTKVYKINIISYDKYIKAIFISIIIILLIINILRIFFKYRSVKNDKNKRIN